MHRNLVHCIILTSGILLFSCQTQQALIEFSTRKVTEDCSQKPKTVLLLDESDLLNTPFEKILDVQAAANISTSDQELLDLMRFQAWVNCANALINVERQISTEQYDSPVFFLGKKNYVRKELTAIAIVIPEEYLPAQSDLSFLKRIESRQMMIDRREDLFSSIILSSLFLALGIAIAI